jgi:uncharacterized protein (UPF0276 family)
MARPSIDAGLGLKPEHFEPALAARAEGLWFEVHAENYMVDGGPRLAWLDAVRTHHPVSLHGVAMSLAGMAPPDAAHLERLVALARRVEPVLVSEHLAWSGIGGVHLPDLLPFPRTHAALARIAGHIGRVQDALGRSIAIENPSHYLKLAGHDWDEIDFLTELVRRSGCTLLLDINNVHVSAHNLGFDAAAWLDRFPAEAVTEVHLAGHTADPHLGAALLIDSHDAPVAPAVWDLCARFLQRAGPRPVLIERDAQLPPFDTLMRERAHARHLLQEEPA